MTVYECEISLNISILVEADSLETARELALNEFFDSPHEYMDERDVDVVFLQEER